MSRIIWIVIAVVVVFGGYIWYRGQPMPEEAATAKEKAAESVSKAATTATALGL